jgi:hypothetical protein
MTASRRTARRRRQRVARWLRRRTVAPVVAIPPPELPPPPRNDWAVVMWNRSTLDAQADRARGGCDGVFRPARAISPAGRRRYPLPQPDAAKAAAASWGRISHHWRPPRRRDQREFNVTDDMPKERLLNALRAAHGPVNQLEIDAANDMMLDAMLDAKQKPRPDVRIDLTD